MLDQRVEILPGGKAVLAENGPLRLVIQAYSGETPELELAKEAAQYSFTCLEMVAGELELLRQPHPRIDGAAHHQISETMINSVRLIGDNDLTPMAAVAGTIADYVAEYLYERGVGRVIVENGGDIAIRLQPGEVVRVGFRPKITDQDVSHLITINSKSHTWGVNTSGLGGRSLTRGIATGVTAFAHTSSVADAAATAIANSCFVEDSKIVQVPANSIDPHTDLGTLPVTLSAEGVSEKSNDIALENGLKKAEMLVASNAIQGVLLAVGGKFQATSQFSDRVGKIERYG